MQNRASWIFYALLVVGVLMLAALTRSAPPPPRTGAMVLPTDYRERFVQYATVDRPDGITRRIYVDPQALAGWQRGQPLPDGTRIIIEAFYGRTDAAGNWLMDDANRLIPHDFADHIHMAEKRDSWRLDELATSSRVGDWNFASFDTQTFAPSGENINDCFTCHDASANSTDFVFTVPLLGRYVASGETQDTFCGRSGRRPC